MSPVEKWVAALESDAYPQCKSHLCAIDASNEPVGFCCLGVACELYQKAVGDLEITQFGEQRRYDGRLNVLPDKVLAWLQLTDNGGCYWEDGKQTSLWKQNDCQNKTFKEIAAIIKSKPEGMFHEITS